MKPREDRRVRNIGSNDDGADMGGYNEETEPKEE